MTASPTVCANRGGAGSSSSSGGPSRGRTACRYTQEYGDRRTPNRLPIANTTTCAASSQALPVSTTTASTTVVIPAAKRGPRGSMPAAGACGADGTSDMAGLR